MPIKFVERDDKVEEIYGGDLFLGEVGGYVRSLPDNPFEVYNLEQEYKYHFNLAWVDQNTWWALAALPGLSNDAVRYLNMAARYKCPYTDNWFTVIVPHTIMSKHNLFGETYLEGKEPWYLEYAVRDVSDTDDEEEEEEDVDYEDNVPTIQQFLLGPGYSQMTLMSDGSTYVREVLIDLDNGDLLRAWVHVWYNK